MISEQLLNTTFSFHGHRCLGIPLGLRCGLTALKTLGVNRAKNSELHLIAELGNNHAVGCFLDGIMAATGCTFGKFNIETIYHNKLAFTLIDKKTNRGVRIRLKDEYVEKMLKSPFMKLRKEGILPQNIESDIATTSINDIVNMPEFEFMEISEIKSITLPKKMGCPNTTLCSNCGELFFINKNTTKDSICAGCYKNGK